VLKKKSWENVNTGKLARSIDKIVILVTMEIKIIVASLESRKGKENLKKNIRG